MSLKWFAAEAFCLPGRGMSDVVMLLGAYEVGEKKMIYVRINETYLGKTRESFTEFEWPESFHPDQGARYIAVLANIQGSGVGLDLLRLFVRKDRGEHNARVLLYEYSIRDENSVVEIPPEGLHTTVQLINAVQFVSARTNESLEALPFQNTFELDMRFTQVSSIPCSYPHPLSFTRVNKTTSEVHALFPHKRPVLENKGRGLTVFQVNASSGDVSDEHFKRVSFVGPTWRVFPRSFELSDPDEYGVSERLYKPPDGVQCWQDMVVVWYFLKDGSIRIMGMRDDGRIFRNLIPGQHADLYLIGDRLVFARSVHSVGDIHVIRAQSSDRRRALYMPAFGRRFSSKPTEEQTVTLPSLNYHPRFATKRPVREVLRMLSRPAVPQMQDEAYKEYVGNLRRMWQLIDVARSDPFRVWIDLSLVKTPERLQVSILSDWVSAAVLVGNSGYLNNDPVLPLVVRNNGVVVTRFLFCGIDSEDLTDVWSSFAPLLGELGINQSSLGMTSTAWCKIVYDIKEREESNGSGSPMAGMLVQKTNQSLEGDFAELDRLKTKVPFSTTFVKNNFRIVRLENWFTGVASVASEVASLVRIALYRDLNNPVYPSVETIASQLRWAYEKKVKTTPDGRVFSLHFNGRIQKGRVPSHMAFVNAFEYPVRVYIEFATPLLQGTIRSMVRTLTQICHELLRGLKLDEFGEFVSSSATAATVDECEAVFHWGANSGKKGRNTVPDDEVVKTVMEIDHLRIYGVTSATMSDLRTWTLSFECGGDDPSSAVATDSDASSVDFSSSSDNGGDDSVGSGGDESDNGDSDDEAKEDVQDDDTPLYPVVRGAWTTHLGKTNHRDYTQLDVPVYRDDVARYPLEVRREQAHIAAVIDDESKGPLQHSCVYDMISESLGLVGVPLQSTPVLNGVDMPVFSTGGKLGEVVAEVHAWLVAKKHPFYHFGDDTSYSTGFTERLELVSASGRQTQYVSLDQSTIEVIWAFSAALLGGSLGTDVCARAFGFLFADMFLFSILDSVVSPVHLVNFLGSGLLRWHACVAPGSSPYPLTDQESIALIKKVKKLLGEARSRKEKVSFDELVDQIDCSVFAQRLRYNTHRMKAADGDPVAEYRGGPDSIRAGFAQSLGLTTDFDPLPTLTFDKSGEFDVERLFDSSSTLQLVFSVFHAYATALGIDPTIYDYIGLMSMLYPQHIETFCLRYPSMFALMDKSLSVTLPQDVEVNATQLSEYRNLAIPPGLCVFAGVAPLILYAHALYASLIGPFDLHRLLDRYIPRVHDSDGFRYTDMHEDKVTPWVISGYNLLFSINSRDLVRGGLRDAYDAVVSDDPARDRVVALYCTQLLAHRFSALTCSGTACFTKAYFQDQFDQHLWWNVRHSLHVLVGEYDKRFAKNGSYEEFISSFQDAPGILSSLGDVPLSTRKRILERADEMAWRSWAPLDERVDASAITDSASSVGELVGGNFQYRSVPRMYRTVRVGSQVLVRVDGTPSRYRLVDILHHLFNFGVLIEELDDLSGYSDKRFRLFSHHFYFDDNE